MTHIAGSDVEIMGRYLRQRCSWCGEILVDYDYTTLAMPGEWIKPGTFPVGKLVRVIDGNPRQQTVLADERLPDDACSVLWASLRAPTSAAGDGA